MSPRLVYWKRAERDPEAEVKRAEFEAEYWKENHINWRMS